MRKKALSSASSCRELSHKEKRLLFEKMESHHKHIYSFRSGQKEKEGRHDVKDVQGFERIWLVTSEYYDVREYSQSLGRRSHPSLLCSDSLSSCGNVATTPTQPTGPWPGSLAVTFTLPTSYERALRLITDLGLQPAMDCGVGSAMLTPGSTSTPWPRWQPVGQRETFLHEHRLLVNLASPPADWFMRLKATPGVSKTGFLDPKEGICRAVVYGTPPPGVAVPLTAVQADTDSRITFTHPIDTYDAALYAISNVGLHLVDPCYEQAWLHNKRATWHPMGQEHTFATTHTLILATNKLVTSSLWQNQLHTLAGVGSIETPYTVKC